MKKNNHIIRLVSLLLSKQSTKYYGLALLFFALSFATISFVHHFFSGGRIQLPVGLFSVQVISSLLILLLLYFLADGLRLYSIIRAMDAEIRFSYIIKLVFINIFISNVTPLATGGGVVQVYFMRQQGMAIGTATAATSIRTMLAALMLFTLTPIIIWAKPDLFQIFLHKNLLYAITTFSCLYLVLFWIILFRIRLIKRWLFKGLHFASNLRLISRSRFRSFFLRFSTEFEVFSRGFKQYFRGNLYWTTLSIVFTAMFLLLLFSFSVVLIKAFGYQIPALTILVFQVVVTFFMYFAPTPGASGVAEAGYGLLFAQLVQKQDITLLTLSWRFLTIYTGVVIGIVLFYREIMARKKIKKTLDQ